MRHVINGDRWIADRLARLREVLDTDLGDEERQAVEDEVAVLEQERGITCGGLRPPRWFRRWRNQ